MCIYIYIYIYTHIHMCPRFVPRAIPSFEPPPRAMEWWICSTPLSMPGTFLLWDNNNHHHHNDNNNNNDNDNAHNNNNNNSNNGFQSNAPWDSPEVRGLQPSQGLVSSREFDNPCMKTNNETKQQKQKTWSRNRE